MGSGGGFFRPARGHQWLSWIHFDDIVNLFLLALDEHGASGPINACAPHPVRNVEFSRAFAKVLHRPFLPIGPPDAILRLVLGEVADVVSKGQRALPAKALALGYHFLYPELAPALDSLYRSAATKPEARAASPHS